MITVAPPIVSLLFAAALALVNLWLGLRTGAVRRARRISIGDGGDPLLLTRMRAQANFIEYVPLALILMVVIELMGGGATGLWAIGTALTAGRVLHPFGLERPGANLLRAGGMLLTLGATVALVAWAVWIVRVPAGAFPA